VKRAAIQSALIKQDDIYDSLAGKPYDMIHSHGIKQFLVFIIRLAAIVFLAFGCRNNSKSDATDKDQNPSETPSAETNQNLVSKAGSNMLVRYCTDYQAVKLRTDISKEMRYFCNNNQPTPEMIALVDSIDKAPQGKAPLRIVKSEHGSDLWSEFWIVWGFKAPSAPIALKDRPIYDFIAKGTTSSTLTLAASAVRQPDELIDHGLHLWSASIDYDLTILGSNNLIIPTKRNTSYNLYQVKAASDDMGLAVEHLADPTNSDYKIATMINLSFINDTGGPAGGSPGGSINLALSHIKIFNRGFPPTATSAMTEVAQFVSEVMYGAMQ
jgi:hypothetical protein